MHDEFTAIIEAAPEGGHFAYCPETTGANGQGETVEDCHQNLAEAIALILDARRGDTDRNRFELRSPQSAYRTRLDRLVR